MNNLLLTPVIESFVQMPGLGDPHVARAIELIKLGEEKRARQVLACGTGKRHWYRCKRRECPSCSMVLAQQYAGKIVKTIRQMQDPKVFLLKLHSTRRGDLAVPFKAFKRGWRKLWASACCRDVRMVIGAIEMSRTAGNTTWNVHVHCVIDVDGALDVEAIAAKWRALVGKRGDFSPDPNLSIMSDWWLARYIAKANTWCPSPGLLQKNFLEQIWRVISAKRLVMRYKRRRARASES